MNSYPLEVTDAVDDICHSSSDAFLLRQSCAMHRRIFAVFPSALELLPEEARNILLSDDDFESTRELQFVYHVTTPEEIDRFYRKSCSG